MAKQTLYFAEARKFLAEEVPDESIEILPEEAPVDGAKVVDDE